MLRSCEVTISMPLLSLIFLLYLPAISFSKQGEIHEVSKMLDYLVGDDEPSPRYDKTLRPQFGGPPVIVGVTINVDSLGPIDEVNMNFRLDLSFRQYWKDSRLEFRQYDDVNTFDKNLTLSHDFLKRIWVPDTYFPESLKASKQDVMVPNVLIRLSPDGSILYSSRTTVIAKCPMDLQVFPMDTQVCSLIVECYGYTTKDLWLRWHDGNQSVATPDDPGIAQFSVQMFWLKNYTLHFSTGSFSDLEIQFVFKRDLLYFILQSYIPSTIIVVCSWIAFWINRDGIPGRACLSITTVLSLITLIGSTNSKLPNVSAVKALDVYFFICFGYVFGGLLEFATVIYLSTKEKKLAALINERKKKQQEYLNALNQVKDNNLIQDLDIYILSNALELHFGHLSEFETRSMSPLAAVLSEHQRGAGVTPDPKRADMLRRISVAALHPPPPSDLKPRSTVFTASKIELFSRVFFPSSFFTVFTFYWVYYYFYRSHTHIHPEDAI